MQEKTPPFISDLGGVFDWFDESYFEFIETKWPQLPSIPH